MEYKVSRLAEQYAFYLAEKEIDIKYYKMPTFNLNAYNEYEYISAIQEINNDFVQVNDLYITEKFLKGD